MPPSKVIESKIVLILNENQMYKVIYNISLSMDDCSLYLLKYYFDECAKTKDDQNKYFN